MRDRRDSFMAATTLAVELREMARRIEEELRLTIDRLNVIPNSQNPVPGKTRPSIDIRHRDGTVLDQAEDEIRVAVAPRRA